MGFSCNMCSPCHILHEKLWNHKLKHNTQDMNQIHLWDWVSLHKTEVRQILKKIMYEVVML